VLRAGTESGTSRQGVRVDHHTTIQELGEGSLRVVCSCGRHSPVFGADKSAGSMDPLQQASDARDLHEWDASLP
jgi:hypothetical protein